jgi:hypothetical protein
MPDQNKQISNITQQLTISSKPIQLIDLSRNTVLISDSTGKELTETLQYIIALLGLSKDRMPSAPEFGLILNFLRLHCGDFYTGELKLAFDFAVKKSFPANLELYGGTLSSKFIVEVYIAYLDYKIKILKLNEPKVEKEPGMTNMQRTGAIFEIIAKQPEALETLKQIGSTEKKIAERPKLPYHDIHQKWLREFDKLKLKFAVPETSDRFIYRYGKEVDVQQYFTMRAEMLGVLKFLRNEMNLN